MRQMLKSFMVKTDGFPKLQINPTQSETKQHETIILAFNETRFSDTRGETLHFFQKVTSAPVFTKITLR